jgi:hypothetical protein
MSLVLFMIFSACLPSLSLVDNDGDGYNFELDCDDRAVDIYPGADEYCDGVDNDCDGEVDEAGALDETVWYFDADGDGFGDPAQTTVACVAPAAFVVNNTDCDDANAEINPAATETCDGLYTDEDCDGLADDDDPSMDPSGRYTLYHDGDGDSYGDLTVSGAYCHSPSDAWIGDATDCDDTDADIHPGADEFCNEVDDDCDGEVDEAGALDETVWYLDADGDGFGDPAQTTVACVAPAAFVVNNTDCDDANAEINPGVEEVCNSIDDDCDGESDEDFTYFVLYLDADGDGYGVNDVSVSGCPGTEPEGFVASNTDCDDEDVDINPGADEYCNEVDDDCDGSADEDAVDIVSWFYDGDSDGYGEAGSTAYVACDSPIGYVADATDCDDTNAAINPGATELASEYGNGVDEDCSGADDLWFIDLNTFCVSEAIFSGCYAGADAYIVGNDPLGNWQTLMEVGYLTSGEVESGFYCFDFYATYPETPRYYEFVLVSAWSVTDASCSTPVQTRDCNDWEYAGGINSFCATGADPYGICDTCVSYSGGFTICLYEDGDETTALESCP